MTMSCRKRRGETINVSISTEGSGTTTRRPKTGSPVLSLGAGHMGYISCLFIGRASVR